MHTDWQARASTHKRTLRALSLSLSHTHTHTQIQRQPYARITTVTHARMHARTRARARTHTHTHTHKYRDNHTQESQLWQDKRYDQSHTSSRILAIMPKTRTNSQQRKVQPWSVLFWIWTCYQLKLRNKHKAIYKGLCIRKAATNTIPFQNGKKRKSSHAKTKLFRPLTV